MEKAVKQFYYPEEHLHNEKGLQTREKMLAESAFQLLITCFHQNVFAKRTEPFFLSFDGHLESFAVFKV
jgi:hypothetical protein